MLNDVTTALLLVTCALALGSGVLQLRRRQRLVLSRSGLRWYSDDGRRRGWLDIAAAVSLGVLVATFTVHSQYLDLLGLAVAAVWLVLILRSRNMIGPSA